MKPKLCVLHGFAGSPRSWDRVLDLVGDGYDVVAPTLAFHGAEPATVDSFEAEVARVQGQLGDSAHVVLAGYSLGARVGLGLLAQAPERFARALLIGVNPGLESDVERAARRQADARWAELLRSRGSGEFARAWADQPLFESQRSLAPELLEQQQIERQSHRAEELAQGLQVLGLASMPSYWQALPRLGLPVTLAAGELDTKFLELARRALKELGAGRLLVAPSAGHNLLLERPDWVARSIVEGYSP